MTGALDTSVTWDVNGVVGGNPTLGTIVNSQTTPNDTTYTAPQALPPGGSVTVNAHSNASPSVLASGTITFTAASNVFCRRQARRLPSGTGKPSPLR